MPAEAPGAAVVTTSWSSCSLRRSRICSAWPRRPVLDEQFGQHAVSAGTRLRKSGLNFFIHAQNVFADLLVIVDREETEKDGFFRLMLLAEADHHGVLNVAFDLGIAGGFGQAERSDGAGEGQFRLLQIRVSPGDGHQILRFIALILNLAPDDERLEVEVVCLLRFTEVGVIAAQVVEDHGFAAAASDIAKDGQGLGLEVERFLRAGRDRRRRGRYR
jgi:hypothetical protein